MKVLPNELHQEILNKISDIHLLNLISTNKTYKKITSSLLDKRWTKLHEAIFSMQTIPYNPIRAHIIEAMGNANSIDNNSSHMKNLFQSLNTINSKELVRVVNQCSEIRSFFYNPLSFLHNLIFDEPLKKIWNRLQNRNLELPIFNAASAIRIWLETEDAQQIIPRIRNLNLNSYNIDGSTNPLVVLPPEIGQFTALEELDLRYNDLIYFPVELGQLIALEDLNLSSNSLGVLPANQLASLFSRIGRLPALKELGLSANSLGSLPIEAGQWAALKKLDLSANSLGSLPANQLASLFSRIGQLPALKELDLSANSLGSLPIGAGQWAALEKLDLSCNSLGGLPANQLASLFSRIGQLPALKELNLFYNQLTGLPAEVGQWAALEKLDLSQNSLGVLPAEAEQWTALKELDLSCNPFTGFPAELVFLQRLSKGLL